MKTSRAAILAPVAAVCAIALPALLAGCGSIPTKADRAAVAAGSRFERELAAYHVVNSTNTGKVGYVKTYDVSEHGGARYQWRYVCNLQHDEVGYIDQFGAAHALAVYSPYESGFQDRPVRDVSLPSDTIERNVMRLLGLNPATDGVTFAVATDADIAAK